MLPPTRLEKTPDIRYVKRGKSEACPTDTPSPNKDGWGSLYYIICDFNNDGQVPNPELLTVPPKPGATQKELATLIALFSAGPDGNPATWEDNMPAGFTR